MEIGIYFLLLHKPVAVMTKYKGDSKKNKIKNVLENCRSLAGVTGWLALFLGILVCWCPGGDMHLTSGAVRCRVL